MKIAFTINGMRMFVYTQLLSCLLGVVTCYSRTNINPGTENVIYSVTSLNQVKNAQVFPNYNGNGPITGSGSATMTNTNSHSNAANGNNNGYMYKSRGKNIAGGNQISDPSQVDPHYVFGSPILTPNLPNIPIFPYNSPTIAPAFQQFPQPNHPGSVLNPAFPFGLQSVGPYNSPYVFGQQSSYASSVSGPVPGGSSGILGGSGGGLAPPPYGSYQNPSGYKSQSQQQHNQSPYNRQTQSHPSFANRLADAKPMTATFALAIGFIQKMLFSHNT